MTGDSIKAEGVEETEAFFAGIVDRLQDMKGAKRPMTAAMESAYEERFRRFPPGFMVESGQTRASLTRSSAPGAVRVAYGNVFRFGSSIPWAQWHAKPLLRVTPSMTQRVS